MLRKITLLIAHIYIHYVLAIDTRVMDYYQGLPTFLPPAPPQTRKNNVVLKTNI